MKLKYISGNNKSDIDHVEIHHYAPGMDITKEYELPAGLREFMDNFESMCRNFIKATELDHNNGEFYDALIERKTLQALKDLELQRLEHVQVFRDCIAAYRRGTKTKVEENLKTVLKDLEKTEKELVKYRNLYFKGTSMEEESL
ncbi:MAG: hypothetical protein K6E34_07125 [Lachnospiraceae bacterium]|nr:hypothetical protein [Lachnospiraceae bacterium]